MKKSMFKILNVREQNPNADSTKAMNGGGYSQPFIEFTFNNITGSIQDTSCGEFGVRYLVKFGEKAYSVNTVDNGEEEYSSFSKECLEDRLLSKHLEEVGYPISFLEDSLY